MASDTYGNTYSDAYADPAAAVTVIGAGTGAGVFRVPNVSAVLPVRAAFYYPWFTGGTGPYWGAWTQTTAPWTQFHPTRGYYDSATTAIIDAHIADMVYAKFGAGIASWWGAGSREDGVIQALLDRAAAAGTGFKWCLYYEMEGNTVAGTPGSPSPTSAQIAADLNYITTHYTGHPNYLHVNGKPVIFVFGGPEDETPVTPLITDRVAARWYTAVRLTTERWYTNLKVYGGYASDNATYPSDSWHQYGPAAPVDVQGSFSRTLSPRFWRGDNALPFTAPVDRATWQLNVRGMVAGAQDWKLVTSYNEWGEGHAVESCSGPSSADSGTNPNRVYAGTGWGSPSGYGWLLDDLASNGTAASVAAVAAGGSGVFRAPVVTGAAAGTVQSVRMLGAGAFRGPIVGGGSVGAVIGVAGPATGIGRLRSTTVAGAVIAPPMLGGGVFWAPSVSTGFVGGVPMRGAGTFPAPTVDDGVAHTPPPAGDVSFPRGLGPGFYRQRARHDDVYAGGVVLWDGVRDPAKHDASLAGAGTDMARLEVWTAQGDLLNADAEHTTFSVQDDWVTGLRRVLSLSVPPTDEWHTWLGYPDLVLRPYVAQIADSAGDPDWIPHGAFVVMQRPWQLTSGDVQVRGNDIYSRVIGDSDVGPWGTGVPWWEPVSMGPLPDGAGTQVRYLLGNLLWGVNPYQFKLNVTATSEAFAPPLQPNKDRHAVIVDLAAGIGAEVFVDRTGVFQIQDRVYRPAQTTLKTGVGGTVVDVAEVLDRSGVRNVVTASSTNTAASFYPVTVYVTDLTDPAHNANIGGYYTEQISSSLYMDAAQALQAAVAELAKVKETARTLTITCVPNYRLSAGDGINLLWPEGNIEYLAIKTIVHPHPEDAAAQTITCVSTPAPI